MSTFANPPRYSADAAEAYVAALLDLLGNQDPYTVLLFNDAGQSRPYASYPN